MKYILNFIWQNFNTVAIHFQGQLHLRIQDCLEIPFRSELVRYEYEILFTLARVAVADLKSYCFVVHFDGSVEKFLCLKNTTIIVGLTIVLEWGRNKYLNYSWHIIYLLSYE